MNIVILFGTVVVVALIMSLGVMTLGNIRSTQTENSTEYNLTGKGITTLRHYNNFILPLILIGIVVFIIVVITQASKKSSHPV